MTSAAEAGRRGGKRRLETMTQAERLESARKAGKAAAKKLGREGRRARALKGQETRRARAKPIEVYDAKSRADPRLVTTKPNGKPIGHIVPIDETVCGFCEVQPAIGPSEATDPTFGGPEDDPPAPLVTTPKNAKQRLFAGLCRKCTLKRHVYLDGRVNKLWCTEHLAEQRGYDRASWKARHAP